MHKRKLTILLPCCIAIFVLDRCIDTPKKESDARGVSYAGSASCQNCHREIYDSYIKTAHNHTSAPASRQTVLGSFTKDSNSVQYRKSLKVLMEERDSGLFQVAYLDNIAKQQARFDMVMGSGSKGQSYLSWLNNTVFQLPVSYFVQGRQWINSPGFPPKYILYNRNIPVGCFECHSSYINRTNSQIVNGNMIDHFDKTQIIYGIDCERCHGPLAEHARYQEENPAVKTAKFVTSIATLQRQQKTELCAICHSGAGQVKSSTFYYNPGSKLSDYEQLDSSVKKPEDIDVHGKQYQSLAASKCFLKSKSLTCVSCHNPHGDENSSLQVFSAKCIACHTSPAHLSEATVHISQKEITANCIDCHMPIKPSQIITMKSSSPNDSISALVRTHFISIYKNVAIRSNQKL